MKLEYFRTDRRNTIKRKEITDSICDFFRNNTSQKRVYNLYGSSGVGKTCICQSICDSDLVVSESHKVLIDFNLVINNSLPGIIQNIIYKLGIECFGDTQCELDKYYKSIDASKAECLNKCLSNLAEELNLLAEKSGELLIVFDTFEALSTNIERKGLQQILEKTNNKVMFLVSGIERLDFCRCFPYNLNGFNDDEIELFLTDRNPKMKAVFKNGNPLLSSHIRNYTNNGNPILCGLVSDWLIKCKDVGNQLLYLINSNEKTYKQLISWIDDLDDDLETAIRLTAYFNNRMNEKLLISLSGMEEEKANECLTKMSEFSFVKLFTDISDDNKQLVLHDVAADLIKEHFPYTTDELETYTRKAIAFYDEWLIEEKKRADDFSLSLSLRVEKILCLVKYGHFNDAWVLFDNELLDAIDVYDYGFIDQIVQVIKDFVKSSSKSEDTSAREKWEYILRIATADVELSKYNTKEAIKIYEDLQANPLYKTGYFKVITDDMFARALINPSTTDRYETPQNAINILKNTAFKLSKSDFSRRLMKSFFYLGNAYVRSGQNDKAQKAYDSAFCYSQTNIQKVMVLLEKSKMLRLQQDVDKALEPLYECDVLMANTNKNRGKYYYYSGNVYRDLGKIDLAVDRYDQAFSELEKGDDDFTLCELYLDYAWLQFIRDDIEKIDETDIYDKLNKGWEYIQNLSFGTEYSEYYHILYEIQNYNHDYVSAYTNLDTAIDFAYKYTNIYMILDCLNHRTQRYYREGRVEKIPEVIAEMKGFEDRGCKIRVFRGRAKLVQADVYFDKGDYENALKEYFEGFVIVALYGNSRSNVELFYDLLCEAEPSALSRKDKIIDCLDNLPDADTYRRKYRNKWHQKKPNNEFDYFLDCLKKNKK